MKFQSISINGEITHESRVVGMHISLENRDDPSWAVTVQVQVPRLREPEWDENLSVAATISYKCTGAQPTLEDAERIVAHILQLLTKVA